MTMDASWVVGMAASLDDVTVGLMVASSVVVRVALLDVE